MKTWILLLNLFLWSPVFCAVTLYKTVPFNNVKMHRNDTIIADYNFGKNTDDHSAHDQLFCYDPSLTNVGKATWTYKNQLKTQVLPVLLKINSAFSGAFADRSGTLTILDTINNDDNEGVIYMSCNFFG